jgi:hypothetical protein
MRLRIDGNEPGVRVRVAATWLARAVGLLATRRLDDPAGLWILPCNSVHTCWMRYAIDVVFVDTRGVVMKVVPMLKPWRMAGCRGACATLELRAGLARELGIVPGVPLGLPPAARGR